MAVCDVGLCNSDSKFQTSMTPFFVNEISSVGMHFLSKKRNILVPKVFDFAEILSFTHLHPTLPCSNKEKESFRKTIR